MTTPQTQTPQFLAGQIMIPKSMLQSWLPVVNLLIPMTSGQLQVQLTSVANQITNILATPPNPQLNVTNIVIPISMINDFKFALATFDYQFHGLPRNDYTDTVQEVGSVWDAYSVGYFNSYPGTVIVY